MEYIRAKRTQLLRLRTYPRRFSDRQNWKTAETPKRVNSRVNEPKNLFQILKNAKQGQIKGGSLNIDDILETANHFAA